MNKLVILLTVLCLALGACTSPEASQSPTATLTPPTQTPSPQPTVTEEPTSTPRLDPTATSRLTTTSAPRSTPEAGIDEAAYGILLDIAYSSYEQGDVELAELLLSEMLANPVSSDQEIHLLLYRGFMQGCLGEYDSAIADYLKLIELDPPDADIRGSIPFWLCKDYGLVGEPELALPYCEQAVQAEATIDNVERRAMVYAQLGRYEDASIDFQNIIDAWGTPEDDESEQELTLRQAWLKDIQSGKDPFTPSVLQAEQDKTCPVPTSLTTEVSKPITRASIQKIFEDSDLAFPFNDISDIAGQEGVISNSMANFGSTSIVLLGPEDEFEGMLLQMQGGMPDYRLYITMPLLEAMFPDKTERAQAIVWLLAGAQLFEGAPSSTEGIFTISVPETDYLLSLMETASGWGSQKNIGNFTLSAETDPEQKDVFRIVIEPTKQ
jgi:hypothetical protein